MTQAPPKVVYKIIHPNGKIYVGLDLTGTMLHFGSPTADIAADFTPEQRRDVTVRKQILWDSMDATDAEARTMEVQPIRELRSQRSFDRLQPIAKAALTQSLDFVSSSRCRTP
jgi:hypothetical protein